MPCWNWEGGEGRGERRWTAGETRGEEEKEGVRTYWLNFITHGLQARMPVGQPVLDANYKHLKNNTNVNVDKHDDDNDDYNYNNYNSLEDKMA